MERSGNDECSGFDPVGNNPVSRAMQLAHALHADRGRACTLDLRAHGVEQSSQIGDFRFASAVLHNGFTIGQRGGHQQVFGAGDRDFVENNFGAFKAVAFERIGAAST